MDLPRSSLPSGETRPPKCSAKRWQHLVTLTDGFSGTRFVPLLTALVTESTEVLVTKGSGYGADVPRWARIFWPFVEIIAVLGFAVVAVYWWFRLRADQASPRQEEVSIRRSRVRHSHPVIVFWVPTLLFLAIAVGQGIRAWNEFAQRPIRPIPLLLPAIALFNVMIVVRTKLGRRE